MFKPKYVREFEREYRKVHKLFGTPPAHTRCFVVNQGTCEVICENCESQNECLEMLHTLEKENKSK